MENEVIVLFSGLVFKNIKLMFLEVIPQIKTFDVVVLDLVEPFFSLGRNHPFRYIQHHPFP